MNQSDPKENTIGDFVKDYLSIIILIPPLIGGIWQLLELMNISMQYIRFFSISQIVPDGILILMFFFMIGAATMTIWYLNSLFPEKNHKKNIEVNSPEPELKNNRRKDKKFSLWYFIVLYSLGILYFTCAYFDKPSEYSLYFDTVVAMFACALCNFCFMKYYDLKSISKKDVLKHLYFFILAGYLLLGYYFCHKIHKSYFLMKNLDNIENVQSDLKVKYPNSKNEILYFNDKYIFIDVTDTLKLDTKTKNPKEKIHIMEMENLFKD